MAGSRTRVPSYQVKVTLVGVKPPVWRRLVVPGQWHLGQVHGAIQVAMGWTGSHLHLFQVGRLRYGEPDVDDYGVRAETEVTLHEVAPRTRSRFRYVYDFGDEWRHDLVVEAVGPPVTRATCLGGRRACPPEDSGGPWGYSNLVAAIADRDHPDHRSYVEWIGPRFDANAFDVTLTDKLLSALR